jgi:hypothetical protein
MDYTATNRRPCILPYCMNRLEPKDARSNQQGGINAHELSGILDKLSLGQMPNNDKGGNYCYSTEKASPAKTSGNCFNPTRCHRSNTYSLPQQQHACIRCCLPCCLLYAFGWTPRFLAKKLLAIFSLLSLPIAGADSSTGMTKLHLVSSLAAFEQKKK